MKQFQFTEEEEFHHKLAQSLTKLFYCVSRLREDKDECDRYIKEIESTLDSITHESRKRRFSLKRSRVDAIQSVVQ